MNKLIPLISIILLNACSESRTSPENALSEGIESCIKKYRLKSSQHESDKIDRVYIHVLDNLANMIFTHGEMGTFGQRSMEYQSFLSCSIQLTKPVSVVYLQNAYFQELYRMKDLDLSMLTFKDKPTTEYLYLRKGERYILHGKQPFDSKKITSISIEDK